MFAQGWKKVSSRLGDVRPCFLPAGCRRRASLAVAERWFLKEQLAAGSFRQEADLLK